MNLQLLQYFTKGELYNLSWVILLVFANDYVKTDRVLAIICVVGAIVLAALKVMHKSENVGVITTTSPSAKEKSTSNNEQEV